MKGRTNRDRPFTIFTLLSSGFVLFVFAGVCIASGGTDPGGGGQDSGKLLDLLYRCINFAVFLAIIIVVVRKTSIKDFFSARREEINRKFEDLNNQKSEFEERYKEIEEKLNKFEVEKKDIIEQFREDGKREKEKIIAEAEERARQIVAQADRTIEREILDVKDRLKEEIVELAARKAQEIVSRSIEDSDQNNLVNEFIKKIEKVENLH